MTKLKALKERFMELKGDSSLNRLRSMATQPAPRTELAEQALRDRIHRIFCGDAPPSESAGVPAGFWVEPTDEQKGNVVMDIHDSIVVTDEFQVAADEVDLASDEHRWLNAPHVDLDGKSPEEMLTADEGSRERLEAFVTAAEAAIRGSFS